MVPIFFDLANRVCVVIGGGVVGQRKAATLAAGGARVRLVCLEARPEGFDEVEWIVGEYRREHLDGAALVLAAATVAVNRQVQADARARGLWVNSATEPAGGDFFMPALLRRGDLTIAVGTGGKVPAMAGAVRDWLAGHIDDAFGRWLALVAELRPLIYDRVADPQQREAVWQLLCGPDWVIRLRRQKEEEVRQAMWAEVERLLSFAPDQVGDCGGPPSPLS